MLIVVAVLYFGCCFARGDFNLGDYCDKCVVDKNCVCDDFSIACNGSGNTAKAQIFANFANR